MNPFVTCPLPTCEADISLGANANCVDTHTDDTGQSHRISLTCPDCGTAVSYCGVDRETATAIGMLLLARPNIRRLADRAAFQEIMVAEGWA